MLLPVHIVVSAPVAGVAGAVQQGKGSAGKPVQLRVPEGGELVFEIPLEVASLDGPTAVFRGPFVQKDAKGQFVYVCWGRGAGQVGQVFTGRAKVYLNGLESAAVKEALASGQAARLSFGGSGKNGQPACATVWPQLDWAAA